MFTMLVCCVAWCAAKLPLWQVETCPSVNSVGDVMRHLIRLVASTFAPISCSDSCGESIAGIADEPSSQSVIDWDQSDVSVCCEFSCKYPDVECHLQ